MRRSRFFALSLFSVILITSIIPAFAAPTLPVADSAVEVGLRDYLSKCDKAGAVVKSELAPTYSLSDQDILGYPHMYTRYCYYYWEGSYGQIVRETVGIVFRRVDVDNWSMSKYDYEPSERKMVQDPTKPLPAIPAQPSKEQLMEEIKNYFPERYSLYEVTAITKLDFPEPKFDWYGADYEWGGYKYSGKVNFTWKKKSSGSQGLGLNSLLSAVIKEKKVCDCTVTMLYSIADNKWHAEFDRLNVIED